MTALVIHVVTTHCTECSRQRQ